MNKKFLSKSTIICFVVALLIATAVLTAVRVFIGNKAEEQVFHGGDDPAGTPDIKVDVDPSSPFYEAYCNPNRINMLLLGVAQKNTDTIMVATYDTDNQKVDIISIPRDSYYQRDGYKSYAYNKINSVYRTDGVKGIAEAVSELLYGMPIDYYAIVEYDDIKKVMDAIGGVYVDVPFRMKYDDPYADPPLHIDIPEGRVLIDSSNVEQYLRFRHGNPGYQSYYNGDLGRIQVQQAFVKLVMSECLKAKNITEVAKVALQNVQSDITYQEAAHLATKALNGLGSEGINAQRLPGYDAMLHDLSFWMPDDTKVYNMLEEILNVNVEVTQSTSSGAVSAQ